MTSAPTQFTTAIAGSGKTYGRGARFLAHEFLPETDGHIWCNYPLNVDALVEYVHARRPDLDPDTLRDRIHLIPDDVLQEWREGKSSPPAYFKDRVEAGAHIAIDEIHEFCHRDSSKNIIQEWRSWLGMLRHQQVTFECLTQYEMKVHKAIRDEAGLQRFMFNMERKPDPIFGILMEDWYELRAGFITGEYLSTVVEQVKMESMGKLVLVPELGRSYPLAPELFPLYDSYNTPHGGGTKAKGRRHPFQEKTKSGLIRWFLLRNWPRLSIRLAVILFAVWLCFLGGMSVVLGYFQGALQSLKPGGAPAIAEEQHQAPQNTAPPTSLVPRGQNVQPQPGQGRSLFNNSTPAAASEAVLVDRAKLEELENKLVEREKEIEKIKSDGARFAEIVALFGNQVTLRCGVTVEVGEQIPLGPLKGRTIKGISHEKRRVILDDNTVLPLSP